MKAHADDWRWCKPVLNVEGQSAFWDAMSEVYEGADMTVDNQKEMDVVIKHCREIQYQDLVTLGGAVGCRDPKMILEDLVARGFSGEQLPVVFYNDLSSEQVRKAKESVLKPFTDKGLTIKYLPGEIRNTCGSIPKKPRRLIIGVYDCHSFFNAHPNDGYPSCGFDEYLKNSAILGCDFLMEWVKLTSENRMISCGFRARVGVDDDIGTRTWIKNLVDLSRSSSVGGVGRDITALQIIGRHLDNPGFFLSHWYTQYGFNKLLKSVFNPDRFAISTETFAKGMVAVVDPIGTQPSGVVTMLNNVIGNVLPDDQFETLCAIREIIV
jgi:hypothetical protein